MITDINKLLGCGSVGRMVNHYAQDLDLSPRVILNRHDGVGL